MGRRSRPRQPAPWRAPLISLATHTLSTSKNAPDTKGAADFLRRFFGPLLLVIVSIVAIFFLFTHEITRFAQLIVLAIFTGIVFYVPGVIEVTATAITQSLRISAE